MDSLNTISLPDFTDLVRRNFVAVGQDVKAVAQQLFMVENIPEYNSEYKLWEEFDHDKFASYKAQGQNVTKGRVGVGYQKTAKVRRFGTEIDITYEMRKFSKYQEVINQLTSLTSYATNRLELDLNHRITFATSTSYVDRDGQTVDLTTGDGLALASASHTLKYSSTTWSNIVSGAPAFSRTGLEGAELLASTAIYNNFGEKETMNFDKIFYADYPTVENLVLETILSLSSTTSQANSGVINVYKNKYTPVKLPYLATTATSAYDSSKKNWWGLVASGQGAGAWQAHLAIWEQPNLLDPMSTQGLVDAHADIWTYGVRVGYGIAIVTPRGFILSNN